jgi:hypothetical protein
MRYVNYLRAVAGLPRLEVLVLRHLTYRSEPVNEAEKNVDPRPVLPQLAYLEMEYNDLCPKFPFPTTLDTLILSHVKVVDDRIKEQRVDHSLGMMWEIAKLPHLHNLDLLSEKYLSDALGELSCDESMFPALGRLSVTQGDVLWDYDEDWNGETAFNILKTRELTRLRYAKEDVDEHDPLTVSQLTALTALRELTIPVPRQLCISKRNAEKNDDTRRYHEHLDGFAGWISKFPELDVLTVEYYSSNETKAGVAIDIDEMCDNTKQFPDSLDVELLDVYSSDGENDSDYDSGDDNDEVDEVDEAVGEE